MSNFGAKLSEILERKKMRAAELARITGLNDSLVSKWINGQQTFVSSTDLAKITGAISDLPKEQAELIKAHLIDEMSGPGSELIDIRIRGHAHDTLTEISPPYRAVLPLKLQRAMDILSQEAVLDSDVRGILLSLANLCDEGTLSSKKSADEVAAAVVSAAVSEVLPEGAKPEPLLPGVPPPGTTYPHPNRRKKPK